MQLLKLAPFALVLGTASTGVAAATPFSNARPPQRYQTNTTVTLEIRDQTGIDEACHPLFGRPPAGMKTDACQTGRRVVAPNPCTFPETETYARLLCHELGHANGWTRLHEGLERAGVSGPAQDGAASSGHAPAENSGR